MPRPCKRRRICRLPGCRSFGPMEGDGGHSRISMTVDEFEAVRLIDLEGLTQEACAARMAVARTTAQAIYNSARLKLAQFLVYEGELRIEGGDYELCDGASGQDLCPCCRNHERDVINQFKEENTMRIAATYEKENGQVFQHFGHTEYFKLYDAQEGQVQSSVVIDTEGSGHGALAEVLRRHHVDALICGGIGGGARQALDAAGIAVYGGVSGSADQAVQDFLAEKLNFDPNARCNHHDGGHTCGEHHHEQHDCGAHGCGAHGCHAH